MLDRYSDHTGLREPLFTDVVASLHGKRDAWIIVDRFGFGSKDFKPAHVAAIARISLLRLKRMISGLASMFPI